MAFVEINRFNCIGDDGMKYVVVERRRNVIFKGLSGNLPVKNGGVDYITSTGADLTKIDENTFKIVHNDIILRRV